MSVAGDAKIFNMQMHCGVSNSVLTGYQYWISVDDG